jgi:6,7-dimethyl-8-ribityllumazine synthase
MEKSGKNLKIAILLPFFNEDIGLELYENALEELIDNGVQTKNLKLIRVPGALELPFAAQKVIKRNKPNVVIALGAVIRGDTDHYDFVCGETFRGLMKVQLKLETPIVFGVLTCKNMKQAKVRASKNGQNKGKSFAEAAIMQSNI